MGRPRIGLIPLVDRERESYWMLPGYMDGLMEAGGVPVMLPLTADGPMLEQMAEEYDGFLFTGGQDIAPERYGEIPLPVCGEICVGRDEMEATLFSLALERDKPLFGICRGLQLFNVLLGGTLYQDLPSQLPSDILHAQRPPYDLPSHSVELEQGQPLAELIGGRELAVNSYHHQGIKDLAAGLRAMAYAPDGLIEAVYMPEKPYVWAVQWHPEFSFRKDESSRALFRSFVQAVERAKG